MVLTGEGIDTQCLSFRSASDAVPGPMTFISIGTAMLGALMFGIDVGNFGVTTGFVSFQQHWCVNMGWGYNNSNPCIDGNGERIHDGECSLGPGCFDDAGPDHYFLIFIMLGNVLITVGAALASMCFAGIVADKYGRRMGIFCGCITVAIGCGLTVLAGLLPVTVPTELPAPTTLNWLPIGAFYVSRMVTGMGVGLCCYALPIYNTETATPGIRGRTGGLFQFFTVLGQVVASLVTALMDVWQIGMLLPAMASLLVAAAIWLVPESPRWVLKTKGPEEAAKILTRLRRGDVQAELAAIQEGINEERDLVQLSFRDLVKPGLRMRVFVACGMQVAQQLTGVNAILGLSSQFFSKMGMPHDFTSTFTLIFNLVALVACFSGVAILDSKLGGRRRQLLVAAVLMTTASFVAGGTLTLVPWQFGAVMMCLYAIGFQFAWGTVPWVYPSEIFSMNERIKAMSVAVCMQYSVNSAFYAAAPFLVRWGVGKTLLIFGALNLCGLVFISAFVKETKGVPLEMVPQLFGKENGLLKKDASLA